MLSPSQGFCYCLPVRLGALVVSFLACAGSAILAGVTFNSLAKLSERITPIQTAGFYLTSVSWISLSLFSLLGFISVILQHPLLLTIFARFVIYHLPANLLCNLLFTVVLFNFYLDADAVSKTPRCIQNANIAYCAASIYLEALTWVYLWIILPAVVGQAYVYVVIRRFIFVINGEWDIEQEHALEVRKRIQGRPQEVKRRATITHSIGHGGRRRAKAELWFTMETPALEEDRSFLPSMVLSPMAFQSPPRSPFPSRVLPTSPRQRNVVPIIEKPPQRSSLRPGFAVASEKGVASDRSARLDMDFSDPDPVKSSTATPPSQAPQEDPKDKGKSRESGSVYSTGSANTPTT